MSVSGAESARTNFLVQGNIALTRDVYSRQIAPVIEGYDFDLCLTLEPESPAGGIYESSGVWATRVPDIGSSCGKITVSRKAVRELSKEALRGLLCHHASAILHLFELAGEDPQDYLRGVNPACLEVSFDEKQMDCFDIEALPPFRYETANEDFKNNLVFGPETFLRFYSAYLNRLRIVMPEVAAEIIRNLKFRDQLNLGEPVSIASSSEPGWL